MNSAFEVAIVGAGPYGLSLAAHLQSRGIHFAIFGSPMEVWRQHMPQGMLLKSDGFASNLSDPDGSFTLKQFCQVRGLPYDDTRMPVPLETFINYGLAFQKRLVPHLDSRRVTRIEKSADGFQLQVEDGESFEARRVVMAVGISHFAYVPGLLSHLPKELLTHSSAHHDCSVFRGKKVTIIGAGASAVDMAALMHESGVDVTLLARASEIRFHDGPGTGRRSIWQRMRNPSSGLGPGWKSRIYTDAPGMFRHLPVNVRLRIIKNHLGPAPGWPMKARVQGKVPMLLGYSIAQAVVSNGGVRLSLRSEDGSFHEHETDHVIAATGYKPDLRRLDFLDVAIRNEIRSLTNSPTLSADFQSSVPGLYFVGIAAANDFGPMMRFAYGSDYTARRVTRHLEKTIARESNKPAEKRVEVYQT
ncbi:MAG TPA: NAD(P)-binding domain-containing protein [Acidobacteriaceae bacterium]|nr:NAD(P)-binding domain-containing protein [Acidobacteriaceae bacterium]